MYNSTYMRYYGDNIWLSVMDNKYYGQFTLFILLCIERNNDCGEAEMSGLSGCFISVHYTLKCVKSVLQHGG